MKLLDDYSQSTKDNISTMVDSCLNNLWITDLILVCCWFFYNAYMGRCTLQMVGQSFLLSIIISSLYRWIYYEIVIRHDIKLNSMQRYVILNLYLALLLAHPSGHPCLDILIMAVIVIFPVWGTKKEIYIESGICGFFFVIRHLILYELGNPGLEASEFMNIVTMLALGFLIVYGGVYVHSQTLVLGNATKLDSATGLYNHEFFYEELEKRMDTFSQLPQKEREEQTFSLLIADIDNFKRVNDTYGHAYGDIVLLELANIFKNYCGKKDFAARYGGEEFVLILGDCQKKDALNRANTIRKKFSQVKVADSDGVEHQFTVSLGVAEYNKVWDTASQFFEQADKALYEAKNTGKNRVCSS